jgi:hypothetical protein
MGNPERVSHEAKPQQGAPSSPPAGKMFYLFGRYPFSRHGRKDIFINGKYN